MFGLQSHTVELVQQYDYLGITLTGAKLPYSLMFPRLELRSHRIAGLVGRVAFQSYSRYELVWGLWKGVGLPVLTYVSDVTCLPKVLQNKLNVQQRRMGSLALGANTYTANEAIQGEMGWSGFCTTSK